jgi:protein-disulfide isomerase
MNSKWLRSLCLIGLMLTMLFAGGVRAQDDADEPADLPGIDDLAAEAGDVEEFLSVALADVPATRLEDGGFILGYDDAPVTIVEFGDFTCPYCLQYKPVMEEFIETYVLTGQARYAFRLFPTAGGQMTVLAARYAECADMAAPGSFFMAQRVLYQLAFKGRYDAEMGRVLAEQLDLNYNKIRMCTRNVTQLETDIEFARELGVRGTPAIMIQVGDGDLEWIVYEDETYNRGGVPFEVLAAVIEEANEAVE